MDKLQPELCSGEDFFRSPLFQRKTLLRSGMCAFGSECSWSAEAEMEGQKIWKNWNHLLLWAVWCYLQKHHSDEEEEENFLASLCLLVGQSSKRQRWSVEVENKHKRKIICWQKQEEEDICMQHLPSDSQQFVTYISIRNHTSNRKTQQGDALCTSLSMSLSSFLRANPAVYSRCWKSDLTNNKCTAAQRKSLLFLETTLGNRTCWLVR